MKTLRNVLQILTIILFILSCSRTSILNTRQQDSDDIKEFNYLGKNKDAYIELHSGKIIHAKNIKINGDTLWYTTDSLKSSSIQKIKEIYFMDHLISTFDGFIFGFLGGTVAGRLYVDNGSEMEGLAIVGIASGGAIIGSATGAILGSKLKYQFETKKVKK